MDSNDILLSKTKNLILAVNRGRPFAFTDFLSFEEQKIVENYFKSNKMQFVSYGGFDDAERLIFALYSDFEPLKSDYPLISITFEIPSKAKIEHRDVLGALMSLGIKREMIGDIIFYQSKCIFFVLSKIAEYLLFNFTSVKNITVSPCVYGEEIIFKRDFEEYDVICTSMRLDCVLSEILCYSRSKTCDVIESGLVYLNGLQMIKKDKQLQEGDVFSVRKKGKYKIDSVVGKTKKDRIKLKIFKYI